MTAALLGRKIGMTRLYDASGKNVCVTVINAGPCYVSQIKTDKSDGYNAVQLAYTEVKARNSTVPVIGHDARSGLAPKRHHREFRVSAQEAAGLELGQRVSVDVFAGVAFVDVTGTSKGKGFSGPMRRWGFKGQPASHGVERKHRSPGSIGGRSSNLGTGKPKKGIRMAGRHGGVRTTVRSLQVIATDGDKGLLLVKGAVPGANRGLLLIQEAKRLCKPKARMAKAS